MRRVHHLVLSLLLALLAGTLLAAPSVAVEEPEEPEPDPYVGAPTAGECSRISYEDAQGATVDSATVSCKKKHRTKVIEVGLLRPKISWDDDNVFKAVSRACRTAWEPFMTDEVRYWGRTAYEKLYFIPSEADREAGARWYRCDIALTGSGTLLQHRGRFPRSRPKPPLEIKRCVARDLTLTVCSEKHRWQQHDMKLSKKFAKAPKKQARQLRRYAEKACGRAMPGKRFVWSARHWTSTRYVVLCYRKRR